MDTSILIALVAVIAIAAIAVWVYVQERHTNRTISEYGNRYGAASARQERSRRMDEYRIQPLSAYERECFSQAWAETQAHFAEDPARSIREADRLAGAVMRARGYPVGEFERRAKDLAADHPLVVRNYRAAHGAALLDQEGRASGEDRRKAMSSYRALFDELLQRSADREREIWRNRAIPRD